MKQNRSLVILDTEDQIFEKINNCDLISFKSGIYHTQNVKKINLNLLNERFLIKQKKEYLKQKKNYLQKISKIFPEVEMHSLEIFNQRNDKIDLFNKIFYFDLIKRTIKKTNIKILKFLVITKTLKNFMSL